jgi:hypothetical protein
MIVTWLCHLYSVMNIENQTQEKRNCAEVISPAADTQVLNWVLEAVAEAKWNTGVIWVDNRFSRNMLLTLLVYAYYKELWTSEEIEAESETDRTLRYICGGRRPTMEIIRQFRRGHREVILGCLSGVFQKLFRAQISQPQGAYQHLQKAARNLADQRIRTAVLMEMVALDI